MSRRHTESPTTPVWVTVCDYDDLQVDVGAAALVRGRQVALFRVPDGTVHAVGNRDPYAGTQTIARGIVGLREGRPFVAAPTGKEVFDLATGVAHDDSSVELHSYPVRVQDGHVEVCVRVRA